jgi:hypothetical protein
MAQLIEFLTNASIVIGAALAGIVIGWGLPLLFDRDVGGALASALLGITGLIVGSAIGF